MSKFVIIPGLMDKDGKLYPINDSKIDVTDSDLYGITYKLKGDYTNNLTEVELIYNVLKRKYSVGVEIAYNVPPKFEVGDTIAYEKDYFQPLVLSKIASISYVSVGNTPPRSDIYISKWEDLSTAIKELVKKDFSGEVAPNTKFVINHIQPIYTMEDGHVISWEHQIKKIKV